MTVFEDMICFAEERGTSAGLCKMIMEGGWAAMTNTAKHGLIPFFRDVDVCLHPRHSLIANAFSGRIMASWTPDPSGLAQILQTIHESTDMSAAVQKT